MGPGEVTKEGMADRVDRGKSPYSASGNLCAPAPHYSIFQEPTSEGLRIDVGRLSGLENPGKYRGSIVVTGNESVEAIGDLASREKCRRAPPHSRLFPVGDGDLVGGHF